MIDSKSLKFSYLQNIQPKTTKFFSNAEKKLKMVIKDMDVLAEFSYFIFIGRDRVM